MHNQFKQLLETARGESQLVIAANVDVREFSAFSLEVESVEAALYIKKIYERVITDYFPAASFFKPTGDGLLLVFDVEEKTLSEQSSEVVRQSRRLVKDFPTLLDADPLINFPVPKSVGIGLARGAACRLASDGVTLDYSGKVLNFASRLMGIARPEGVVIAGNFRLEVLDDDAREGLVEDSVYIRSIAETTPTDVYYAAGLTTIPMRNRQPLIDPVWEPVEEEHTLGDLRDREPRYGLVLPSRPLAKQSIELDISHPVPTSTGDQHASLRHFLRLEQLEVAEVAGRFRVFFDMSALVRVVEQAGVKDEWPVRLSLRYIPA